MFSNDPLGDICTKEEVKFLSEKRKMYSSINSKIRRLSYV
tara:strand:+ start:16257 stop:16376 length:120 start_codon:yes stop_codon:yes gene_type:complete